MGTHSVPLNNDIKHAGGAYHKATQPTPSPLCYDALSLHHHFPANERMTLL